MPARIRNITGHERRILHADWELRQTAAGRIQDPASLAAEPGEWLPGFAPSTVAACLRGAGLWSLDAQPPPLDGADWWYRTRFDSPPSADGDGWVLGFDGLATCAQAWLNGVRIVDSDNMFVAHECDVTALLRSANELVIRFAALEPLLTRRQPRPRWRAPMVAQQQLRWIRTTLLGRTPGWSPSAPPVGPWRPVWLERRRRLAVTNFRIRSRTRGTTARIEVSCDASALGDAEIRRAELHLTRLGTAVGSTVLSPGRDGYAGELVLEDVELWWPHTHGTPALYDCQLSFALSDCGDTVRADVGPLGFRSLGLDLSRRGAGLSVNGVPVFCRGACWTPLDVVSPGDSRDGLDAAIARVRSAGFNMLRISGTQVYESDAFLDACDASGLLLWHDFMFANMDYPESDPAFRASVELEARQQLTRLAARPSTAVLCGNSEVEQQAAMWGAARHDWQPALFHVHLPELVAEACPDVPYWPSSAHGGALPFAADEGSTSWYGVGAYLRPLAEARSSAPLFATECLAFANVPEAANLALIPCEGRLSPQAPAWKARSPRDLGASWDFDDVRDHYLHTVFGMDPLELRYSNPERYLALSRVVTGEAMASCFAAWRSGDTPCRGALILWLRDLWAGAGWGIIDSEGRPKAAYHLLKRVLQPRALLVTDEGMDGLVAHAVNDCAEHLDAMLEVSVYRGEVAVARAAQPIAVPAHGVTRLALASCFDSFIDLNHAYRFGPPGHDLVLARLTDAAGRELATVFHSDRRASLCGDDPGLCARASRHRDIDGAYLLTLSTRRFARSIWIEADGWQADDAYFSLAPAQERIVELRPLQQRAGRALRGSVQALNSRGPVGIRVE